MMKNWLGLECHPTDEYVHWAHPDGRAFAQRLRDQYDLISELGPEYRQALNSLLTTAREYGYTEALDDNNPDL